METNSSTVHSRWYRSYVDLLFPRTCSICNVPIVEVDRESLCQGCRIQLQPIEHGCHRCSAPLPARQQPSSKKQAHCFYCKNRTWAFRKAYCYLAYEGTGAKAARKIKQPNHEPLAMELGTMIGQWLVRHPDFERDRYDYIIPIPQYWMRRLSVRYNQADVLAEHISKQLECPVLKRCLYRTRWTDKQGTKSMNERLQSVNDSFACRPSKQISGSAVLLVDDIVTSGATSHDAARALKKAGVKLIDVAAWARGVGAFGMKTSNFGESESNR